MSKRKNKTVDAGPARGTSGSAPSPDPVSPVAAPQPGTEGKPAPGGSVVRTVQAPISMAVRLWLSAYRVEVLLFVATFCVLAMFSGQRFLRQSAAPHFVYQSQAWLEGRLDIDPQVLPNLEDWACVRESAGVKVRCEGAARPSDRWYSSFPAFPSVLMLPFVAVNGYQLNDTSFTVICAALGIALFYSLLRQLTRLGESRRAEGENIAFAATLALGTLFFSCAIRGEVWFTAEVIGVGLTALYVRNAVGGRRPLLAGLFYSMATLTRTPLLFSGVFFLLEVLCPGPEDRLGQLRDLTKNWPRSAEAPLRKLGLFALGTAPLAAIAAWYNLVRFGSPAEFGHRFLFNNRVNEDIDRFGLFNVAYLPRNLEAAFLKLPELSFNPLRLGYSPYGLTLLLTLPLLLLLLRPKELRRLQWPLWLTVAACALPGLAYQNTGYMQFGFRFSLDYTPHLVLLLALGGWSLKHRLVQALLALGFLVNFWGAAAFRGYTELVRHW